MKLTYSASMSATRGPSSGQVQGGTPPTPRPRRAGPPPPRPRGARRGGGGGPPPPRRSGEFARHDAAGLGGGLEGAALPLPPERQDQLAAGELPPAADDHDLRVEDV